MQNKRGIFLIALIVFLMAIAVAVAFLVAQVYMAKTEANEETVKVRTFAEWTEDELFVQIPAMIVQGAQIGEVADVGAGNYIIDINGTTMGDYEAYLSLLKDEGYQLLMDNGEEGIDGDVFNAQLQKDDISVTVVHIVKTDKTYVIAGEKQQLSQYLTYDENSTKNLVTDETMLAMLELRYYGNSFVFRLKNGHFIVNDGGQQEDMIYLIEYLESFMKDGEKPIIDCWIISHAHGDHMGIFWELDSHPDYAERFYVEEMLFSQPSSATVSKHGTIGELSQIPMAAKMFRTTDGEKTPIIRPIMGQKYYFCDVVMEVVFSQEFLPLANYSEDLNDSSTWLMYNIEGQKVLFTADGIWPAQMFIKDTYDKEYLDLAVYFTPHHGADVYNEFTNYLAGVGTVLYTNDHVIDGRGDKEGTKVVQNQRLLSLAEEAFSYGEGTVVMTFPYEVGTAKILPLQEWIYNRKPPTRWEE